MHCPQPSVWSKWPTPQVGLSICMGRSRLLSSGAPRKQIHSALRADYEKPLQVGPATLTKGLDEAATR